MFSASPARADAPGLSVTFSFKCDVSGTQALAEWTITNNDLLDHDVAYDFKLDDQVVTSTVDHLNAGQADLTGSFPVPDGKNFMMYVVENQQVIANSGEHIADLSSGTCFAADLPPNPPPVAPSFEFYSECHPAGALFKVKATSNDGLEHKMQLFYSIGGPGEIADPVFWLIAGSPTAHSGTGFAPHVVAKLWVVENGVVLAESPWWRVDANEADCSADDVDPNSYYGPGDGDTGDTGDAGDPPASDPAPQATDGSDLDPARQVEPQVNQHAPVVESTDALPRTGVSHLTLEALTGTTLVLFGYALVRFSRRRQTI
jgi:hypothetical protein